MTMDPEVFAPPLADEAPNRARIARASAINLAARLVGGLAALLLAVLTTHVLDVHGRGQYAILTTLATIAATVLTGVAPVVVADFVHGRRNMGQLRGTLAVIGLTAGAISVLAVIAVDAAGIRLPASPAVTAMTAVVVAILIYSGVELSLAQGRGDIWANSIGETALAVVPLVFSALAALSGHSDIFALILAWLVGVSCVAAVQVALAVRDHQFTFAGAVASARDVAWRSRSIAFSNGVLQLCSRIDVLIVSVVLSVSAAGIYSIPVALGANMVLFSRAPLTAMYRSMMTAPLEELEQRLSTTIRYGAGAVLAAGALTVPVVAFAAGRVFGHPYAGIWEQLAILVPAIAALSAIDARRHVLLTRFERHREVLAVAIGMVIANAVLAVAGSLLFGLNGAAASTTITYAGAAVVMFRVFSGVLKAAMPGGGEGELDAEASPAGPTERLAPRSPMPGSTFKSPLRRGSQQRLIVLVATIPLVLAILGILVALLYSSRQGDLFEARSQVVVSPATKFLDPSQSSAFPSITTTVQELALTQLVTRDAARVLSQNGFKGATDAWVRKRLRLSISGQTPVLAISGVADSQRTAQAVSIAEVNALTQAIAGASGRRPRGLTLTIFARGEPLGQIQPKPARNALLGGVAGLLLGSFLVTLLLTRPRPGTSE